MESYIRQFLYHYNQLEITCDIPFRYSCFAPFGYRYYYSLFTIHRLLFTTAQYTIQLFTIHYSSPLSSPLVIIHHYFTNFRYSTIHYFTVYYSLFFFVSEKPNFFFSMNMRSVEEFDDYFFVHRVSTIFFQFFFL